MSAMNSTKRDNGTKHLPAASSNAWEVMKPFVKFSWKAMKVIVHALAGIIKLSFKTYPDNKADHTVPHPGMDH